LKNLIVLKNGWKFLDQLHKYRQLKKTPFSSLRVT